MAVKDYAVAVAASVALKAADPLETACAGGGRSSKA